MVSKSAGNESAVYRIVRMLVFSTMFALPWINQFRVATFLLFVLAGVLVFKGVYKLDYALLISSALFRLFLAYYLLLMISWLVFPGSVFTQRALEHKASLMIIPLIFYWMNELNEKLWGFAMKGFIAGVTVASVLCFGAAIFHYATSSSSEVFFYHRYASTIKINAIYFSFYILIALAYLIFHLTPTYLKSTKVFGIILVCLFLLLNLLLLSSKMMIVSGLGLLTFLAVRHFQSKQFKWITISLLVLLSILLLITSNPIKARYTELNSTNITSAYETKNFTEFPFNGLTLRLVLWRLGLELVNEHQFWVVGAGGERYHDILNDKIKAYQLYAGDGTPTDRGYLDYNMHNQYVETYVQYGIVGLGILISIFFVLFRWAFSNQLIFFTFSITLFLLAFLSESMLETQSGILLFTILTSGEWIQSQKKIKISQN